jgi:hypothetical protein
MGHRILESILVIGKGVFSYHTVKHMHAHLVNLNLYKGSYSVSCKEDLSRTPSFTFLISIPIQNVGTSHFLERTR